MTNLGQNKYNSKSLPYGGFATTIGDVAPAASCGYGVRYTR